jgi:hypothetical protein
LSKKGEFNDRHWTWYQNIHMGKFSVFLHCVGECEENVTLKIW